MKAFLDWRRGLRTACVITATAWLCACGGGGGGNEETPPPAAASLGDPVSRTVGVAGGTVEAASLGIKVRLSFPADALAKDTVISVTPQQPATGDSVSLKLTPSGVFFAKAVTVVLEYPAGQVPDKTAMLRQSLGGQDAFVVTSVDTIARTISGQLTTFGGTTLQPLAVEGRKTAHRATVQADAPADDGGTLTVGDRASIDTLILSGQRRLDALLADERFGPAYALQVSLAALIQRSGEDGYTARAEPFLRAAHDSACAARTRAITTSQAATITLFGQFKTLIEPILYWDAAAQRLGVGSCSGISTATATRDVIAKEFAFAQDKMERGRTPDDVVKPSKEVKDAREVISILRELQRTDASAPYILQAEARHQAAGLRAGPLSLNLGSFAVDLRNEFIDPMLDPARRAGWTVARDTGVLSQYETLFDAFGPTSVLQQDVQFARTRIAVASSDSRALPIASATLGFAAVPDLPAPPVRAATVQVSKGGALQLSGSIAQLECTTAVNETLKVSFEGVEVASINGSAGMLASGAVATFTPEALLAAARLPIDDEGVHSLVVRRTGSACAAAFGITDEVLATVALDFGARPLKVVVRFASAAVKVPWTDIGASDFDIVRATELSLPFHHIVNMPAKNYRSDMSLKLDDPNTLVWSGTLDSNDQPSGAAIYSIDGTVTFPKSGTATLTLNPAWIVTTRDCVPVPGSTDETQISPIFLSTDLLGNLLTPSAPRPAAVILNTCGTYDGPIPTILTASAHVDADTPLAFQFAVRHLTGHLIGSGTIVTLHFEPTP